MATYKEIKGFTVQSLASDLATPGAEGQIWFNTTGNDFKTIVKAAGSWSTGGDLPAAINTQAVGGIQTAAISASGNAPGGATANVQSYNGSSWTEEPNVNTARTGIRGVGTTSAFVVWGGSTKSPPQGLLTEEYDGSSWTEVSGSLNTVRYATAATGTATAALATGGNAHDPMSDANESYDGSTWTELADLNTGRQACASSGITTSAIVFGGGTPGNSNTSETWDNSSWTEGNNLNTARTYINGTGTSVPTAFAFGGRVPGATAVTEAYDGASWTELADLNTARGDAGGAGTVTAGLLAGGNTSGDSTEEWNWSSTLQTGAWASGGNLPNPASTNTGFGPGTAGVHAGGELSGASNAEAFHYDGSSWTAGGNINQTRNVLGGYGTQTSGAIVGGHMDPTPTTVQNVHETYDGTTWSEAGDLQTGRAYMGTAGCGTTTAALVMAGLINPELSPHPFGAVGAKNESEEYNGTSWAEGNNVNTARYDCGGAGTQTAGLLMAGNTQSPNALKTEVESYDGTSWSEVSDVNSAVDRISSQCGGTQDIAIKISGRVGLGDPNPSTANVEQWDGTAWAEVANVSTARQNGGVGSAPSASSAFFAGGTPPATNATEEWTLAQNVKTITD